MAYATLDELKDYLPQAASKPEMETLGPKLLDRATAIIEGYLKFEFGDYSEAAARKFNSPGGKLLRLPPYQAGSLTSISLDAREITNYEVDDDDHRYLYRPGGWPEGRYLAVAAWGCGPPPDQVVEVCLELAVNFWRGKDRGLWTDVIGAEGGGSVGYARALTNQQRMALDDVRNQIVLGFA
jgi:hypothetical protein